MSLIAFGSIHEGHEWFSDDYRGGQEIFMCLAALLCEQFLEPIREVPRYRSSPTFLSVYSSSEGLAFNYFHSE